MNKIITVIIETAFDTFATFCSPTAVRISPQIEKISMEVNTPPIAPLAPTIPFNEVDIS